MFVVYKLLRVIYCSEPEPVSVAVASYAPPTSPTMHQILETFLEDDYLPGKLADIINKCVER
jgi:hypothetical protein